MNSSFFLQRLDKEIPNFQIWYFFKEDEEGNVSTEYHWKAKSGVNQWEYSKDVFDTVEDALLDFLSQVTRFTLERNG